MTDYLPLFPLDVVLFPEMLLPLHIFEERYKEMIGECLQERSPFGVLYANGDRVEAIGCTAEINQVIKRYPDGRLDIVALGRKRFQVSFFDSEKAYLRASVELLPDLTGDREPSDNQAQQALELAAQAWKLMGQDQDDGEAPTLQSSSAGLAFRLASSIQVPNGIRQRILEARSENQRLEELTAYLVELIPQLTEKHEAAKKAGSNGHLH
jgi:Lon protease-like protein